jgi:pimeloyl-ACP methyl ester carboxylesterase
LKLEERQFAVNGLSLHCVMAGQGPLVVLLHGFPEFWYGWRHQIAPLAEAGLRVVAVDMRGYNLSSKPSGIDPYRVSELAGDVGELVRQLGATTCRLVGHDWGGIAAWFTAMIHPAMIERLVVMSCPHPVPFARELKKPPQRRRSSYMARMQVPWLPELFLRAMRFRYLRRALRLLSSNPEAFSSADLDRYVEAWRQPGALRAMLNYYRALRKWRGENRALVRRIDSPTLLIRGQRDPVFVPAAFESFREWVPDLRTETIADASHFVQADAPERVNRLLINFLRE